jgi:uncharacterized membrane protein
MGDIDYFVAPSDYLKSKKILSNLGYSFSEEGEGEIEALKDGICLELHQKFGYFNYPYLENYDNHLIEYAPRVYTFDDLYFFLHNLGHAYFHMTRGGIGLKYLLDFYLLFKNKYLVVDEMIPILKNNNLYNFFLLILNICLEYLNLSVPLNNDLVLEAKSLDKKVVNAFLKFMIFGGEYGSLNNPSKIILMRKDKKSFIFHKLFPSIKVLYKRQIIQWWQYPLVPFVYIGYIFKHLFSKKSWKKISYYNQKLDNEQTLLFNYLGI